MKKIESYKSFTVVAWVTVIAFSAFTYKLTTDLNKKVDRLAPTYQTTEVRE